MIVNAVVLEQGVDTTTIYGPLQFKYSGSDWQVRAGADPETFPGGPYESHPAGSEVWSQAEAVGTSHQGTGEGL